MFKNRTYIALQDDFVAASRGNADAQSILVLVARLAMMIVTHIFADVLPCPDVGADHFDAADQGCADPRLCGVGHGDERVGDGGL